MTTTEPEWDESSRSWAMALGEYEDFQTCPRCGLPKDVCQAAENEGRFETEPPIRCFAATALHNFAKNYEDDPALIWTTPMLRSSRG